MSWSYLAKLIKDSNRDETLGRELAASRVVSLSRETLQGTQIDVKTDTVRREELRVLGRSRAFLSAA